MSENNKMYRGTLFLTVSTFISQLLGMLYIIPFYGIMGGEENLALYGYAYTPYTIMLSVASAGVPGAVSKFVAKYNALGAFKTSEKLYKSSLVVMITSGFVVFGLLWFLAPLIADIQLIAQTDAELAWNKADITNIIRVISFAVIIVPFMATWRGIFQGFESFGPTSVSGVVEQIVRITVLLGGSFIAIKVLDGSIQLGNQVAVFAAFIAAISATLVLFIFWRKRKPQIKKQVDSDHTDINLSYKTMYKEIIRYAVPFIVIGITFPMTMFIDQLTHNNALAIAGVAEEYRDAWFGMLNITTQKLVMIPVGLASAFAISILPFITKSFQQKRFDDLEKQVSSMVVMQMFFVIPAAIGMMILAAPLYTAFYSFNEMGIKILTFYAPVCIIISLFSMTASIVQGIDKQNLTVFVVLSVLVTKALLNIPMITKFYTVGATMSTIIALFIGVILNFIIIKKYGKFHFRKIIGTLFDIVLYGIVMLLAVEIVYFLFMMNFDITNRLVSVALLAVAVPVGVIVYFILTFKSGLADKILGERANAIRRRLKFL